MAGITEATAEHPATVGAAADTAGQERTAHPAADIPRVVAVIPAEAITEFHATVWFVLSKASCCKRSEEAEARRSVLTGTLFFFS